MMNGLGESLLASTAVALAIALFAAALRSRIPAATRHALWLLAAVQFAIPLALVRDAGMRLASIVGLGHAPAPPGIDITRVMIAPHNAPMIRAAGSGEWSPVLVAAVWMAPAAILLAAWLRRLLAARPSPYARPSDAEREAFDRAKRRMGIDRPVELTLGAAGAQPSAHGWRTPAIMIPAGLSAKLGPHELESILLHELAHVKRRDNLWACVLHALSCVFWFHPLLWWIERQAAADRERACDELVLARGAEPNHYIEAICRAVRFCAQGAVTGVSPANGVDLKQRMEMIMSFSEQKHQSRIWRLAPALLTFALLAVPLSTGLLRGGPQTLEKRAGVEFVSAKVLTSGSGGDHAKTLTALAALFNPFETPQLLSLSNRWAKWLSQDVAYLIRPEERAAFLRLGSDEERAHFVDQFWAQRAQAAGLDEHTLRAEHERRLSFATEHYSGTASDRARLYVVMGPPDEIESHPSEHYEQWLYHSLDRTTDSLLVTFNI